MRKARLLTLAAHLMEIGARPKSARPRLFHMDFWMSVNACGTEACAFGEACFIPEFQALGLAMIHSARARAGTPSFKDSRGFDAATLFFGIGEFDAEHLFAPACYFINNDPLVVARRIEAFVARGRRPYRDEAFVPLCHVSGVNLVVAHPVIPVRGI